MTKDKTKDMTKDMTKGNPLRLILWFALPLIAGNLMQQGYNLVDAAIVGQFLGSEALGAVGASSSVQFLVTGFCIGTCLGFTVPVAQRFGAEDYSTMRRFLYNGFIFTILLAVVLTLVCALACGGIIHLLSTPAEILPRAYTYLLIIFLGIPFTLLYNFTSSTMRAVGDSRTPFIFLAISTCVNILLDLVFVTVLRWGVAGAAAATISSQAMSGFLCLYYVLRKYPILQIKKEERSVQGRFIRTLAVMGFPMGLQYSITAIGSMVMQSLNNGLGSIYVSGFTAANRIKQFAMCPFDAMATAVATFCSQNLGAKKLGRIRQGLFRGTVIGIIYGVAIGAVLVLFGRQLSMLFISAADKEVLSASTKFLYYTGFFYPILGTLIIVRLSVQGLGYTGRAVLSGIVELVARSAFSLVMVPMLGFTAICFTDQAAWISATIYIIPTALYVLRKIKRKLGDTAVEESSA